jgi:hypothetical protein
MNTEKLVLIVKGTLKRVPGIVNKPSGTGGTIESRYCYSVWLRHLLNWNHVYPGTPDTVAELGPGDSLGIGLAALLSGSNRLYALDVIKYWDNEVNLRVFDELTSLFMNRENIPGSDEYPRIRPVPSSFDFPSHVLNEKMLGKSLSHDRIENIRREIMDINNPGNNYIKYKIPWHDMSVIEDESVDFIYSQAVLECVDEPGHTYNAMNKWLKHGGLMSHTIDLKSHITKEWNGHWLFSNSQWNIAKGRSNYLFNRMPASEHLKLHSENGFRIIISEAVTLANKLTREDLNKKFRNLTDDDITTSGLYILSVKE